MHSRKFIAVISPFIIMICMGTECNKDVIAYQYNFLEELTIIPVQPAYHINDTVWLQHNNNTNYFTDVQTQQRVRVDTSSITLAIFYYATYDVVQHPVAVGGFCDFVIPAGMVVTYDHQANFSRIYLGYGCNSNLNFRLGIVPRVKGSHKISFFDQNYVTACNPVYPPGRMSAIKYTFPNNQAEYSVNVE